MPSPRINFHKENIKFRLASQANLKGWLSAVSKKEGYIITELNFIFCSDSYLKEINKAYLNHNFFTDIITFDYSESKNLEGDIFISIDRVIENSKTFNVSFVEELKRVMVHGLLHLMGYRDKTDSEKREMRKKEDRYLSL